MRAAITTDTRVNPVEANQERIAGQMDELHAIAADARREASVANERITALDDYDVQEVVAVNFRVNSAALSAEAKQQLDALAAKASGAKAYVIEVAGILTRPGAWRRIFSSASSVPNQCPVSGRES